MPGPISDGFDPEWGSMENAHKIKVAIQDVYSKLSGILGQKSPLYILDLVREQNLTNKIKASLTEKEWRILRFTCERAEYSI